MLYGYPVEAVAENWLHETLCAVVNTINAKASANEKLPDWPEIIPEAGREALKRKTGLESRINNLNKAFIKLTPDERITVLAALTRQNNISALTSCECDCLTFVELPVLVQNEIKELFLYAFGLLTDLKIRDRHYAIIYNAAAHHVCPFCGLEFFEAPGQRREDYDHYLLKDVYPLAAANLRNLVPMGGKCNSSYKKMQDILKNDDGIRRRSFNPYNNSGVAVSLDNSVPFEGNNGQPRWQIEFAPATEESTTWENVFHIRDRYIRNVLDPDFKGWLRTFGNWCRVATIAPTTGEELIGALDRYIITLEEQGLSDRAFLKVAVFKMLRAHCAEKNQRLIEFLFESLGLILDVVGTQDHVNGGKLGHHNTI